MPLLIPVSLLPKGGAKNLPRLPGREDVITFEKEGEKVSISSKQLFECLGKEKGMVTNRKTD